MKISVDVIGVEQALNFDTLEQTAFLVIDVLGQALRVPISEEQMEELTKEAVRQKQAGTESVEESPFEETRETVSGEPSAGAPPTTERAFQITRPPSGPVMSELSSAPPGTAEDEEEDEPSPTGLDGVFGDEEQKVQQLRARPRPVRSDDAGSPVVDRRHTEEAAPPSTLPKLPGFGDEDFPQG